VARGAELGAGGRPLLTPRGSVGSAVHVEQLRAHQGNRVRASGGSTTSSRAPYPASSLTSMPMTGPATSTSTRPSGFSLPTVSRLPSRARRTGSTAGSASPLTRADPRRASTAAELSSQAAPRSNPSGRTTAASVGVTSVTRPTRKVRVPASVPATRYQTPDFVTSPSGETVRDDGSPARPV
jgi:hypothetical protein